MLAKRSFTLSEVARRLDVPQHRLIHLCEKGVVVPDIHGATGRGSSRVFSSRNLLELAVALRLREMMLPVGAIGVDRPRPGRSKTDCRRSFLSSHCPGASRTKPPDLRIIVSDGQTIYFSLGMPARNRDCSAGFRWRSDPVMRRSNSRIDAASFQETRPRPRRSEQRQFARLELSITAIARELPVD